MKKENANMRSVQKTDKQINQKKWCKFESVNSQPRNRR